MLLIVTFNFRRTLAEHAVGVRLEQFFLGAVGNDDVIVQRYVQMSHKVFAQGKQKYYQSSETV